MKIAIFPLSILSQALIAKGLGYVKSLIISIISGLMILSIWVAIIGFWSINDNIVKLLSFDDFNVPIILGTLFIVMNIVDSVNDLLVGSQQLNENISHITGSMDFLEHVEYASIDSRIIKEGIILDRPNFYNYENVESSGSDSHQIDSTKEINVLDILDNNESTKSEKKEAEIKVEEKAKVNLNNPLAAKTNKEQNTASDKKRALMDNNELDKLIGK